MYIFFIALFSDKKIICQIIKYLVWCTTTHHHIQPRSVVRIFHQKKNLNGTLVYYILRVSKHYLKQSPKQQKKKPSYICTYDGYLCKMSGSICRCLKTTITSTILLSELYTLLILITSDVSILTGRIFFDNCSF